MNDMPEDTVGIADEPLSVRRAREVENQREIHEGLTRRHVSIATYRQRYLATQFARILHMGKGEG